jgi:hypothetical protein
MQILVPRKAYRRKYMTPLAVSAAFLTMALAPVPSAADEGGVSFWLPGQYASLAATPLTPGWAFSGIYYHSSIEASGGQTFTRGGGIQAGLNGDADLGLLAATYVFADPVLGGQAAVTLAEGIGRINAFVEATLTGPGGGTISGEAEDTRTGFSDLYPTASLRWNEGVNNFMVYLAGDIPIGAYDDDRLAKGPRRSRHREQHHRPLHHRQWPAHECVARRRDDAVPQREDIQLGRRLSRASGGALAGTHPAR